MVGAAAVSSAYPNCLWEFCQLQQVGNETFALGAGPR